MMQIRFEHGIQILRKTWTRNFEIVNWMEWTWNCYWFSIKGSSPTPFWFPPLHMSNNNEHCVFSIFVKLLSVSLGFLMCHIYWSMVEQFSVRYTEKHVLWFLKTICQDGHIAWSITDNISWFMKAEMFLNVLALAGVCLRTCQHLVCLPICQTLVGTFCRQ